MPWDFLVIANPVWETAHLVERIPDDPDTPNHFGGPAGTEAEGAVFTDGGGSGLNTACALAMAGRRVLAVGRVGDDMPGRACFEALQRRGVETACEILPGRTTKRNTCFVERGTHATAFAAELPEHSVPPWEGTPVALLEARVLLLDRLAAAALTWLKARTEARDKKQINALVRNSMILSPTGRERLKSALPHLGYLQVPEEVRRETPSSTARTEILPAKGGRMLGSSAPSHEPAPDEAPATRSRIHRPRSLAPLEAEEVAAILAAGVRLFVRTREAHGVVVHTAEGLTVELPAAPTEVVDPTGAGDAFAAGFLDALLDDLDPAASARRGLDWAARACRHLGARAWLDHEPPAR
jgi:sugar/nucleoside kinase (ribokinase family)